MAIVNVNSFESRISDKNFLTNYTDKYLKQSLANLGQRLSVKGDSIVVKSFKVSDLFSNYLGSFNEENLMIQFKYYPEGYIDDTSLYESYRNTVVGNLVYLQSDGSRKTLNEMTGGKSANSSITITNTNDILTDIDSDDYSTDIYINETDSTNGSAYWHRDKTLIAKLYDSELGKNVYVFRLVGHNTQGKYGPYDNEFIFDEVTEDGEFVSGLRIFIANEQHLMLNSSELTDIIQDNTEDVVENEHLVMLYLHKDPKYGTDNYEGPKWQLSVYDKNPEYKVEIGDITTDTSDDLIGLINTFNASDSAKPEDIINILADSYSSEALYQLSASGEPMFSHKYDLPVKDDTEDNVGYKVVEYNGDKSKKFSNYQIGFDEVETIDDDTDNELIDTRLEYFVNDTTEIFPVIQSIFNSIMYEDTNNLKIKKQVVAQFVKRLYDDYILQDSIITSDTTTEYEVCMPYDLEFKYNGNSNVSSVIYNTTASISTQFLNISSEAQLDVHKTLTKIANQRDDDGIVMTNSQLVVANTKEDKTVLYDLVINYLDNDIISDISWGISFVLPYINTKGYWTVNDIETDIYAKGSSDNSSGLVILSSDNPDKFDKETGFIFASGKDVMEGWDFVKRPFASKIIDSESSVDGTFTMNAFLPSDDTLTNIAGTEEFSYINNSLVCVMSSVNMESDLIEKHQVYKNIDPDVAEEVYEKSYEGKSGGIVNGTTYYIYKGDGSTVNSYIWYNEYRENSLYSTLGENATVTSFWEVQKKTDYTNKSTYYTMTYITRPNDSNVALDLTYLGGLEQFVKHYAASTFSPDNFLHRWLVFSKVENLLKNNTIDVDVKAFYPLIRNYDATYFTKYGSDPSRALGEIVDENKTATTDDEITNQQYANNLNLAIEFTDRITEKNEEIVSTNNDNLKHFHISQYGYTYQQPVAKVTLDTYNRPTITVEKETITKQYGYIPYAIQYTYFDKEYIPNTYYNANDTTSIYQYPELDLKEVLLKNVNTFNRYNIIGIGREELAGTNRGVLYNAYIGTSYDQENKSHLKIGTGATNVNLGMSTMLDGEDIHKLTPMDSVDVEFAYINLSGDTFVSGNLTTKNAVWKSTPIEYSGSYILHTYSTVVVPASYLTNNTINSGKLTADNRPKYVGDLLSYETEDNTNTRYYSRYVQGANTQTYHSYLNVHTLLRENGVNVDRNSKIYGDSTVLTYRTSEYDVEHQNIYDKVILATKLYNTDPGIFTDMVSYIGSQLNLDVDEFNNIYSSYAWYKSLVDKYITNGLIYDFYKVIYPYIKKSSSNKNIVTWGKNTKNEYTNLYEIELDMDINTTKYVDLQEQEVPGKCPEGWTLCTASNIPYFDTILEENNFAYFLELSTNLVDKENWQCEMDSYLSSSHPSIHPIVVSNPIEISYTDIPSYCATIQITEPKTIVAYMYVDGTDIVDETDPSKLAEALRDYYKVSKADSIKMETHEVTYTDADGNEQTSTYIDNTGTTCAYTYEVAVAVEFNKKYAYNEAWHCTGCDSCSRYTCNLIGICKHSSLSGSFRISYGYKTIDKAESRITQADKQEAANSYGVFRYMHVRYYEDDFENALAYYTYSYYPDQDYEDLDTTANNYWEKISYYVPNASGEYSYIFNEDEGSQRCDRYILTERGDFVAYGYFSNGSYTGDFGKAVKPANRIPYGKNIVCTYTKNVIQNYAENNYQVTYTVPIDSENEEKGMNTIVQTYSYVPINDANGYPSKLKLHWEWYDPTIDSYCKQDGEILSSYHTYTFAVDSYTFAPGGESDTTYYPRIFTINDIHNNEYSYVTNVVVDEKNMYLTYRYVNIRELYTNHTTPEYYNGIVGAKDNDSITPTEDVYTYKVYKTEVKYDLQLQDMDGNSIEGNTIVIYDNDYTKEEENEENQPA